MMAMKRRTIYKYIKFSAESHSPSRKPGSGRPRKILAPKQVDQLIDASVGKVGVSFRKPGRQFGVDKNTIKSTLAYYGIYKKKRKKIPKSDEKQKKKKQITRMRKLYEGPFKPTCSTEVIVDDEC
jgi:hypothetical protein